MTATVMINWFVLVVMINWFVFVVHVEKMTMPKLKFIPRNAKTFTKAILIQNNASNEIEMDQDILPYK